MDVSYSITGEEKVVKVMRGSRRDFGRGTIVGVETSWGRALLTQELDSETIDCLRHGGFGGLCQGQKTLWLLRTLDGTPLTYKDGCQGFAFADYEWIYERQKRWWGLQDACVCENVTLYHTENKQFIGDEGYAGHFPDDLLRDLVGPGHTNSYVKCCLTPERSIATIPIRVARVFGKCQSKWGVSDLEDIVEFGWV
eukprot:SAG22_NODE_4042_length_1411_cov_27.146341_3_plen_196_part_00